jgi:hypothetical protein
MENGVNLIIAVLENGTVKRETRSSARSRLLACFEHIASCFLMTFIGLHFFFETLLQVYPVGRAHSNKAVIPTPHNIALCVSSEE